MLGVVFLFCLWLIRVLLQDLVGRVNTTLGFSQGQEGKSCVFREDLATPSLLPGLSLSCGWLAIT